MHSILVVSSLLLLPSISCQPSSFDSMSFVRLPYVCRYPFTVHMYTAFTNCSGTIIHDRWILTAARCLYNDDGTRVKDDGVSLLAGASDFTKVRVSTAQTRQSLKLIIHEDFIFNTLSKFDIALIKVQTPFNLTTECVQKATIADDAWPTSGNRSKNCIVWGYGQIQPNQPNTRLKVWTTNASHGPEACPCANRFQAKRLICSKEATGINLCRGDLGSSLLCRDGQDPFTEEFSEHRSWQSNSFAENPDWNNFSYDSKQVEADTDTAGLKVYGVAHMTIDKYRCDITRVPKRTCLSLPTYAAYMYLCPFNPWLREHVPDLPENITKCGLPLGISLSTTLLAVFLMVLLVLYK